PGAGGVRFEIKSIYPGDPAPEGLLSISVCMGWKANAVRERWRALVAGSRAAHQRAARCRHSTDSGMVQNSRRCGRAAKRALRSAGYRGTVGDVLYRPLLAAGGGSSEGYRNLQR